MEEILHHLIGSLSHYLQGFIHPRWCRISSINSIVVGFSFLFRRASSCQVFVLNSFATKGELSFLELVQAQTYWKALQRNFSIISTSEFCLKKRSKKTHTYPHRESNIYIYIYIHIICVYIIHVYTSASPRSSHFLMLFHETSNEERMSFKHLSCRSPRGSTSWSRLNWQFLKLRLALMLRGSFGGGRFARFCPFRITFGWTRIGRHFWAWTLSDGISPALWHCGVGHQSQILSEALANAKVFR